MSAPYSAPFVSAMLRHLSAEALALVKPGHFQVWPAQAVETTGVYRELIAYERARRAK